MPSEAGFSETLESRTVTYLDKLTLCSTYLPELLDAYASDSETAQVVESIERTESECDDIRRSITALITNTDSQDIGLLRTRIKFNQSAHSNSTRSSITAPTTPSVSHGSSR